MIRRHSLTFRLTLLFALAATAVLLVLGFIVKASVEQHFQEQDMTLLEGKLELIRHALERVHRPDDLDTLVQQMDDALIGHHGLAVAVTGTDGRTLFATRDSPFPQVLLERVGKPDAGQPYVWDTPDGTPFRGIVGTLPSGMTGMPPAIVAVATDISHHRHFMAAFLHSLWLVVLGGSIATGLLGWIVARRGLAPLREMGALAAQVSARSLDRRLPAEAVPVELAELARSLNDMLSRLEDSFRRLSDFSSDLAHELRTPVSNLMTQTQVALSRTRTADEYREVLESNAEEFERLSRMVSDMLFLAKADNGLIVPARETFELADEVGALFDFYGAVADERHVVLRLQGRGRAAGDRLMLRRALGNLLSNALRHTPEGGRVDVKIDVTPDEMTRIAVENSGEPIPAEHLPRLFDRFYRADPSRHSSGDGAGLGLAITRSIIQAHGGEIHARAISHGNVFEFTLPPA